jgi:hypothetical protein
VEVCGFRSSSPSSPGLVNRREVGASRSTALDVLTAIERIEDNLWVITGMLPGAPLYDLQPFWQRVRARAGLNDVRIHPAAHLRIHRRGRWPRPTDHRQVAWPHPGANDPRYAPWLRTWFESPLIRFQRRLRPY